jgi:hypothetical protein
MKNLMKTLQLVLALMTLFAAHTNAGTQEQLAAYRQQIDSIDQRIDASLHALEQATGVNKSGLYAEFKGKEDLFVQSLRYYVESLEKEGLLTAEPLGWNNVERFLKLGPRNLEGQKGCFAVSCLLAGTERQGMS